MSTNMIQNDNDWGGNIVDSSMKVGIAVVSTLLVVVFLFGFSVGWAVS